MNYSIILVTPFYEVAEEWVGMKKGAKFYVFFNYLNSIISS
jgi:hypothetical protein